MTHQIRILSVNTATEQGRKYPHKTITLDAGGVQGDVHQNTLRQVSMLNQIAAQRFNQITGAISREFGSFAENITFETDEDLDVKIFDRLVNDQITLEVLFKGKPFHDEFRDPGHYVMPREGIFCRVLKGGSLQADDTMAFIPKTFNVHVITLSDRAYNGIYSDRSGPEITLAVEKFFKKTGWRCKISNHILPDDPQMLEGLLTKTLNEPADLIITTGGTGIGPRDNTPEVVGKFVRKDIPGIMEMIRWKYGVEKPAALVSRAIAGANGSTLLFALPGSVKAVNEYMTEIGKHLEHLYYMVHAVELH